MVVIKNINFTEDWKCLGIIGSGGNSIVKEGKLKNQKYPNYLIEKNVDICAIKIIEEKYMNIEEIEILIKLKETKNLPTPKLLGYGKDEKYYYIFMELIKGTNLYDSIDKLSVEQKNEIIFQLAQIIKRLHSYKILHGDVKIQNILVSFKKKIDIWLLDFGNGHYYDYTKSYYFKKGGTPGHSSKRAINGCSVGRKEDIYSFGVTVLLLMNGYNTPHEEYNGNIIYKIPKDFPNGDLKILIESCIDDDEDKIPTAEQLFEFDYFKSIKNPSNNNLILKENKINFKEYCDKFKSNLGGIGKKFKLNFINYFSFIFLIVFLIFYFQSLFFLILIPIYLSFKSLKFGQSFGSRVLVDTAVFTSNKLSINQKYIHMEESIILLSKPIYSEIHNKIQVILTKNVVLKSININAPIKHVTLPKGLHISILPIEKNNKKIYFISFSVTIEKPFYRKNEVVHFEGKINESYFSRNIAYRYYAFSRHGLIYVKSQYIKPMDMEGINDFYLFLMLMKIFIHYIVPKNETHHCFDYFEDKQKKNN